MLLVLWRARVCSSMMALVSRSRRAPSWSSASFSRGNIQRSHGMCSATVSDALSFIRLPTIALNSNPCSSNTPSEFIHLFPNASLVLLLNDTSPKYFLNPMLFPTFSAHTLINLSVVSSCSILGNYQRMQGKKQKAKNKN